MTSLMMPTWYGRSYPDRYKRPSQKGGRNKAVHRVEWLVAQHSVSQSSHFTSFPHLHTLKEHTSAHGMGRAYAIHVAELSRLLSTVHENVMGEGLTIQNAESMHLIQHYSPPDTEPAPHCMRTKRSFWIITKEHFSFQQISSFLCTEDSPRHTHTLSYKFFSTYSVLDWPKLTVKKVLRGFGKNE